MRNHKGFTLIELSLSLIFIAILSVTVVLLIQNTTAAYRRGLVLNQLNSVGMDLVDELRSSIQNASSDNVLKMCRTFYAEYTSNRDNCENDSGASFVMIVKKANVETSADGVTWGTAVEMPVYGAICTGTYTYIWNSGYFESAEESEQRKVSIGTTPISPVKLEKVSAPVGSSPVVAENFRLLKIYDAERTVCVNNMKVRQGGTAGGAMVDYASATVENASSQPFVINNSMLDSDPNKEGGVEMLSRLKASDLVLYDLYVAKPAISATRNNFFYSAAFILGTRRGGVNIMAAGNSCKPPNDNYTELDYCAINRFNFAVMAGGV